MKVAIPSFLPGGLESAVSPHFGHCDAYTLVDLEEGQVQAVEVLPNPGHEAGGCLGAVHHLKSAGAEALVAGGMGMRPLMGFQEVGITVFHSGTASTVAQAVELLGSGAAQRFAPAQVCQGHDGICSGH
ncbi:MAG: NifB/NifX family molybdenum-iron cluster-binding protein [Deltaproteobacteria bacterium]|nr:NifB/NifX family molybdenum-iron cluster-binding protein [Deltaproteobacteria bacterium]